MPHTRSTPEPAVTLKGRTLRLRLERILGLGDDLHAVRFLQRAFRLDDVRAISLDRHQSAAAIRLNRQPRDLGDLLRRISDSLRDEVAPTLHLPRGAREATCTIHRHGDLLTTCEVLGDRPGVLRLRHEAIRRNPSLARLAEQLFADIPGVKRATFIHWSHSLTLYYDPAQLNGLRLIRFAEECLDGTDWWGRSLPAATRTRFGLANTNLGLAAAADLVLPLLAPVSALLLLYNNRRTFKAAALQVRRRKLGLPVLYTVIVGSTLAGGQFLASALMSWCFQYWHGRLRSDLTDHRRRILDECLPIPHLARFQAPEGVEVLLPVDRLQPGNLIAIDVDEYAPVDGRVVEGEGIVDEQTIRGVRGASRKRRGETILAGSRVVAGSFRIEVIRPADQTRAWAIGRSLVAATSPAAGTLSPYRRAEDFAERAIAPTLATAGVGLLTADLTTMSAILRPDYATGPGVAGPLQTLHDAADCAGRGIIVRSPEAFHRLVESDLIVIEDVPALRGRRLEVATVQTRMPESLLLRYAASAYRHLADDRANALIDACREPLLDLPLVAYDPGITVTHGTHRIRVSESGPDRDAGLVVEVDEQPVGWIEFQYTSKPPANPPLARLREFRDVPVLLLSDRGDADAAQLARALGATEYRAGLSAEDKVAALHDARLRGKRPCFVGDLGGLPGAGSAAYVAVSLGGAPESDREPADAILLRPGLDALVDLWEIARRHDDCNRTAQRFILLPNLLCVAGALFLGATALTAVVVSNLGTLGLYSRATGSLQSLRPSARGRTRLGSPTPEPATAGRSDAT